MDRVVGTCLSGRRTWLTFVILLSMTVGSRNVHAAPIQGDIAESGCYHMLQHYNEGDNITTNEPCLNCTCRNSRLACFLQVCPFAKPIGEDCVVEKREDQCCPAITCPPVPVSVSLLNLPVVATTTKEPATTLGFAESSAEVVSGCNIDGTFYPDGAQVPGDPSHPCQLCYCIHNHTACILQQCTLVMSGCSPVYQEGLCCPVRYNCDSHRSSTTTTTTVRPVGCVKNGQFYEDGSSVPADESCEFCYCMGGDVVCALPGCPPPPDQFGFSEGTCVELPLEPGQCCPAFRCSSSPGTDAELPEFMNDEPATDESPTTDFPGTVPDCLEKSLKRFDGSTEVPGLFQRDQQVVPVNSGSQTRVPGSWESEEASEEDSLTEVPVQIVFSLSLLEKKPRTHQSETPEILVTLSNEPSMEERATESTGTNPGTMLEESGASKTQESPVSNPSSLTARTFQIVSKPDSNVLEPTLTADIVTEKFQAVIREPNALEAVNITTVEMNDLTIMTAPVTTEGILTVPEAGQATEIELAATEEPGKDLENFTEVVPIGFGGFSKVPGSFLTDQMTTELVLEDLHVPTNVPETVQVLGSLFVGAANQSGVLETFSQNETNVVNVPGDAEGSKIVPGSLQEENSSTEVPTEEPGIVPGSPQTGALGSDIVPEVLEGSQEIPGSLQAEGFSTDVVPGNVDISANLLGSLQERNSSTEVPREESGAVPGSLQTEELGRGVPQGSEEISGSLQAEVSSTEVVPGSLEASTSLPGSPQDENSSTEVPREELGAVPGSLQTEELGSDIVPEVPEGSQVIPGSLQAEVSSTEAVPGSLDVSTSLPGSPQDENSSTEVPREESGTVPGSLQTEELGRDIPEGSEEIPGSLQGEVSSTEVVPGSLDVPTILPGSKQGDEITTVFFQKDLEHNVPESSSQANLITEPVPVTPEFSTPATSFVPGEGTCLVNGVTYSNEAEVPGSNPCQVHCRCQSSIVTCKMIFCPPPPVDFTNCRPSMRPGKCCPVYDCDGLHGAIPGTPGKARPSTLPDDIELPLDKREESLTHADKSAGISQKLEPEDESRLEISDPAVSQEGVLPNLESPESSRNSLMSHSDSSEAGNDPQMTHEDVEVTTEIPSEDFVTDPAQSAEVHEDLQLSHDSLENLDISTTTETIETQDSSVIPSESLVNPDPGFLGNTENEKELEKIRTSAKNTSDSALILDDSTTRPSLESEKIQESLSKTEKQSESSHEFSDSISDSSDSKKSHNDSFFESPTELNQESSQNMTLDDSKTLLDSDPEITQAPLKTQNTLHLDSESQESSESLKDSLGILTDSQLTMIQNSSKNLSDLRVNFENQESSENPSESLTIPDNPENLAEPNDSATQQDSQLLTRNPESSESHSESSQIPDDSLSVSETKSNQESSKGIQDSSMIPNDSETLSDSSSDKTLTFKDSAEIAVDDSKTHTDSELETLLALESAAIGQSSQSPFSDNQHLTSSAPFPVDPLTWAPSCVYEGRVYLSAQQIRRRDACDFCFCFRGDIICLQQSCPPPLRGCFQEPIPGYCCPRYECPVLQMNHNTSVAVVLKSSGIDEVPSGVEPEKQGCQIGSDIYQVGQLVTEASGPCLTCRCGNHGLMECDPQQCQPEPILRKVIAFSADRRRRRAAPDGTFWLN